MDTEKEECQQFPDRATMWHGYRAPGKQLTGQTSLARNQEGGCSSSVKLYPDGASKEGASQQLLLESQGSSLGIRGTNHLARQQFSHIIHRSYHIHILSLSHLYQANRKIVISNILLAHNFAKKISVKKRTMQFYIFGACFQTTTNLRKSLPLVTKGSRNLNSKGNTSSISRVYQTHTITFNKLRVSYKMKIKNSTLIKPQNTSQNKFKLFSLTSVSLAIF